MPPSALAMGTFTAVPMGELTYQVRRIYDSILTSSYFLAPFQSFPTLLLRE